MATAFPALKLFTNGPFDASYTFDATALSRLLVDMNAKRMWCKNGGFGRGCFFWNKQPFFVNGFNRLRSCGTCRK